MQDSGYLFQFPFFKPLKFPTWSEHETWFKDAQAINVKNDGNGFEVELDAKDYHPEEIKIRVEDGVLIIEGNHEESSEEEKSKNVHQKFYRQYQLPEDCKAENVTSNFTKEGVLKISAPKAAIEDKSH